MRFLWKEEIILWEDQDQADQEVRGDIEEDLMEAVREDWEVFMAGIICRRHHRQDIIDTMEDMAVVVWAAVCIWSEQLLYLLDYLQWSFKWKIKAKSMPLGNEKFPDGIFLRE